MDARGGMRTLPRDPTVWGPERFEEPVGPEEGPEGGPTRALEGALERVLVRADEGAPGAGEWQVDEVLEWVRLVGRKVSGVWGGVLVRARGTVLVCL